MSNKFRALMVRFASLLVVCFVSVSAFAGSNSIVISQVYGAGGNGGAIYNEDYVELFNLGTTPVSLAGWSLQYRSTAGSATIPSTEIAALPNVTLQPGQYYLFGVSNTGSAGGPSAAGANGTAPAFDAQLTALNLAGGAGQVILSNSTVAQPAGCVTSDPSVIDFVGYGSSGSTPTVCSEGGTPTATISATLAAFRTKPCVDTDNNGADFSVAAPAPRTSATTFTPCATGTQAFALTGVSAKPTTVSIGSTTLLTARITPATGSTGVAVSVDLSSIGGSSTQPLYDDATNGDPTAADNVFNFTATIAGNPSGTVTLPFKATDAQAHSATGSVTLTIQATAAVIPIHTLQAGAPNTTYVGQVVTTTGIVTAITSAGFFLEARDSAQDADPATSEGIFVVSGSSASVVIGNELNVTGTVKLSSSSSPTAATEIAGTVTLTGVTTGNPLPTPITLTTANDSPTGGFTQFLRYQSMRVLIPSLTVTAGTGGTLAESTETITSTGDFYGVVTGVNRPLIEPGVSILETSLPTGATYCTATVTTNCVPRFDGNPENLYIQSTGLGGKAINVNAGQTITNLLGVFDFTTFNFDSLRNIQILLDKTAPGTPSAATTYVAVPAAAANEFTVASTNLQHFYSSTPFTGAVTLTAEAYARRLAKASLEIRNVQGTPDIVGLQEIGSLPTLNDLAAKISADAVAAGQPDPKYSACLIQGNDSSDINTAFLVKTTRVTVVDCTQFGKSTTYTNSTGSTVTLNDRPPLVLHATVNLPGYAAFPITVISNHLKSLIGIDDTTSTGGSVRLKKEAQDEYLAALIQGYQAKGEHVVSVGDYNSFGVNDGYVDNLGVITGNPPAAGTVVVGPSSSYVAPNPKLVDLETTVADPLQRYDYSFIGNAQTLDHIVVTADLLAGAHIAFSHENADFALINLNDGTTPLAGSDHDGAVAFFPLLSTGQTSSATLTPATQDFGAVIVGNTSTAQSFTLTNTGNTSINVNSLTASGDFTRTTTTCGTTLAASATCTVAVTFSPTTTGARTGSLIVTTSAVTGTTLTATLTGSGTAANATVTLTPATATFGTITYGASSAAQTFTLTNTGNVSATITSITAAGDFARTTTCGATLAPAATCTAAVTFTPTAVGARTGSLTVATSGSTTALVSTLSGTGSAQATLTPASSTLTGVVGTTTTQVVTLTNTAGAALAVGNINLAGSGAQYTQANNCATTLAAGASCTFTVSFAPLAGGSSSGTLTVSTTLGTASTTLTATFAGTATVPPGFTLTPAAQAGSTTAGNGATVNLTLTSLGGYTATLRVSCSGAPAGSTCTPAAPTLLLNANGTTNLNVTIKTSSAASAGFTGSSSLAGLLALAATLGAATLVFRRRRLIRIAGLLTALLAIALYTTGCGSSSPASTPTPAGTYPYTITATDGTLSQTAKYTLTVQ